MSTLSNAVVWTSKDSYKPEYGYYNSGIPRGLSICGETTNIVIEGGSAKLKDGVSPHFYTSENLAFATNSKWKDLLDEWFPGP